MDTLNDTNLEKVPFDSKDFLALESKFQGYVQQVLQEAAIGSQEERDMLKGELEQWSASVFTSLSANSAFTDTDGMDNRGKLSLIDPTDEELKEKVRQKDLEFNADLKKVVKYRAQAPTTLAKLSKEICESESMEAENLRIELPTIDINEDQLNTSSLELAKDEYKDAMQLLSNLEKTTPKEVNQITKVQKIATLFIDRKDMN